MNNNNTYNQPPQGPMLPPSPMNAPRPRGWRERWMNHFGMSAEMPRAKELTIPTWLTGKSIVFFFVAMFACWTAFGYVPGFDLILIACITIILFFYGGSAMAKGWSAKKEKTFVKNIFIAGLIIRLLWILYCYFFLNPNHYGNTYGETADVEGYIPFGKDLALWISNGFDLSFEELRKKWMFANDDFGYPMWLGIVYFIFGSDNEVFIPFLIKCILSTYCIVCIYRVARRHFGDGTARVAAIFVCLNPNMIYWCGTMFKEVEMVFLCCLAIDNLDRVLSSGQKYTFKNLLPGILAGLALMFFRSALGLIFFMAVFAHIVMVSRRVIGMGKKIMAGLLVAIVLVISMGDSIRTQSQNLIEKVQSDDQQGNMEWRSKRADSEGRKQSFAMYAGAAVFAPLIFTIPFPTFNEASVDQVRQVLLSGGSYIKNILSFFVILVMLMMLISGEWRRHVFILAYTVGYHVVLIMSPFAQSGRFHMPVWPMIMLFAAYGIQIAKTNARVRKWFPIVLVLEVAVCLVWNWFKLKGRGMI